MPVTASKAFLHKEQQEREVLLDRGGFSILLNPIRVDRCPDRGRWIKGVGVGGEDLA